MHWEGGGKDETQYLLAADSGGAVASGLPFARQVDVEGDVKGGGAATLVVTRGTDMGHGGMSGHERAGASEKTRPHARGGGVMCSIHGAAVGGR